MVGANRRISVAYQTDKSAKGPTGPGRRAVAMPSTRASTASTRLAVRRDRRSMPTSVDSALRQSTVTE